MIRRVSPGLAALALALLAVAVSVWVAEVAVPWVERDLARREARQ